MLKDTNRGPRAFMVLNCLALNVNKLDMKSEMFQHLMWT